MNRRDFLLGLGAATAGCAPGPQHARADPRSAEIRLFPELRSHVIASDFIGLSYETSLLAEGNFLTPDNHSLIALMQGLAPSGLLRIGGNSSEFALWQRESGPRTVPFRDVVTPATIDRLSEFLQVSGWRLIYGLNLGHGDPDRAADEAAYVAQRLGDRLEAFQIGNEPDLYERHGLRPAGYSAQNFIAEWKQYAAAIHARAGDVPLAGPDIAYEPDWLSSFASAASGDVRFLSDHYYPVGPANDPEVDIAKLLRSELPRERYSRLREAGNAVLGHGKPLRITEGNSCYGGGKPGLSDSFAASLWALNLQFNLAHDGWSGMCFHGGPQGSYTPIVRNASGVCQPRPLYYGLLAFAQTLGLTLIDNKIRSLNKSLRAYAAVDGDGKYRLALINFDTGNAIDASISAGRALHTGSALRLSSPTLFNTEGTRFGDAAADARGRFPAFQPEVVEVQGESAFVTVSAASAVIVSLE